MKTIFAVCSLGVAITAIQINAESEALSWLPNMVPLLLRDDYWDSYIWSEYCQRPIKILGAYEYAQVTFYNTIEVKKHLNDYETEVFLPDFDGFTDCSMYDDWDIQPELSQQVEVHETGDGNFTVYSPACGTDIYWSEPGDDYRFSDRVLEVTFSEHRYGDNEKFFYPEPASFDCNPNWYWLRIAVDARMSHTTYYIDIEVIERSDGHFLIFSSACGRVEYESQEGDVLSRKPGFIIVTNQNGDETEFEDQEPDYCMLEPLEPIQVVDPPFPSYID